MTKTNFKPGDIVIMNDSCKQYPWYSKKEIILISNDNWVWETNTYIQDGNQIHEDYLIYVDNINERRLKKLESL